MPFHFRTSLRINECIISSVLSNSWQKHIKRTSNVSSTGWVIKREPRTEKDMAAVCEWHVSCPRRPNYSCILGNGRLDCYASTKYPTICQCKWQINYKIRIILECKKSLQNIFQCSRRFVSPTIHSRMLLHSVSCYPSRSCWLNNQSGTMKRKKQNQIRKRRRNTSEGPDIKRDSLDGKNYSTTSSGHHRW